MNFSFIESIFSLNLDYQPNFNQKFEVFKIQTSEIWKRFVVLISKF